MRGRMFHKDDEGFSTVGMVLALLLSLSLLLGAAQVYRIRSVSADIQNIADACALAAENQVASFYIVAQVCDSVVFSLALAGTATVGLGIVAACIPPTQGLSVQLIRAGKTILDARSNFAKACTEGLNKLQALLPLFAAIDAAALAVANNTNGTSYHAIAILAPFHANEVEEPHSVSSEELEDVDATREIVAQAAEEAQSAIDEANSHKLAAFMADCGNAPEYCMAERAETLAGMQGGANPVYASVDAWHFSVALERARTYYWHRYINEAPLSDAADEIARSAIRKRFYAYAVDELAHAYVTETDSSFAAHFPLLPRNTEEMRSSRLYTEAEYPITQDVEGNWVMHASLACPGAMDLEFVGWGAVAQTEEEEFLQCDHCQFSATSVGKVAAASTSINNGFEYHYQIVAREAALYEQARSVASAKEEQAKNPLRKLFDALKTMFEDAARSRIKVEPPGRIGALAVVFDAGGFGAFDVVSNNLVAPVAPLGTRVALSAATLVDDDADETATVISSLLDNLFADAAGGGVFNAALDMWSGLMVAYTKGTRSLTDTISAALDSLPLVGKLGLGKWAADSLQNAITTAGLEPPDLVSRKPLIVNSYYVASADSGAFCKGIANAKSVLAHAYGPIAQDPLSALVGIAGGQLLASYDSWDATFVIARIELFGDSGTSIPVEITLPPAIKDAGASIVEQALSSLLVQTGQMAEVQRWE